MGAYSRGDFIERGGLFEDLRYHNLRIEIGQDESSVKTEIIPSNSWHSGVGSWCQALAVIGSERGDKGLAGQTSEGTSA